MSQDSMADGVEHERNPAPPQHVLRGPFDEILATHDKLKLERNQAIDARNEAQKERNVSGLFWLVLK